MDEANLLEKWFVARMIKIDLKEKSSIGFLMSLAMVGVKAGWLVVMRMGRMLWLTRLTTAP